MQRVGFVLKREKPEADTIARELVGWLAERGVASVVLPEKAELAPGVQVTTVADMAGICDIIVCLGGDGTLLNAAAIAADGGVPVLGVNLGTMGFNVPFNPAEACSALAKAVAGELPVEERMRLGVHIYRGGEVTTHAALNDAVLSQGSMARLVELRVTLDGQKVADYKADGLIIATPTGSTAYNLAAGGPILTPGQASFAITPICPHTLTHRPLVVPACSRIGVSLGSEATGVVVTLDGQWGYTMTSVDRVEVFCAVKPLLLYQSGKGYFEILREKLSWGSRLS